jgi:hypothetical protein
MVFRINESKNVVVSKRLIHALIMNLRRLEIPVENKGLGLKLTSPYV